MGNNSPLINIITRCARPENIKRCLNSVSSQTYKNIHHIVTYQNDEIKDFLKEFEGIHKVRVPNLKAIKGLALQHYVHPGKDNFLNPDLEWMEKKIITDFSPGDSGSPMVPTKPEPSITVWDGPVFHVSLDYAYTVRFKHFPYDIFLKIAEQHVKEGWVVYLDDDDYLKEDTALEELVKEINMYDNDTLHLSYVLPKEGKDTRDQHIVTQMKGGMPFICFFIGGSFLTFHTKYIGYTAWDEWSGSDWKTAKCLEAVIPKKNWIDNYFIKLGGTNAAGDSHGT
tara:strand:- start:628 stop:1473 length:846 start_codon:yes stop_codon:yes gene_type:complete